MRYFICLFAFLVFLISCGKVNEKIALDELRKIEYTRNSDSQKLISFLNHENPDIRLAAVKTLGRIQDTSTVVLLANRLSDENESVRREAAFALGQLFSPVAENYLKNTLKASAAENIRIEIIRALGKSGTDNSFNILKDFLESDNSSYEKPAAIACGILAYRNYPPYGNTFPLEDLLTNSQDDEVKWRSAFSLFRIGNPASFKKVYEQMNYPNSPLVRFFAIKALGAMLTVMQSPAFQQFKERPMMTDAWQLSKSSEFFDNAAKMLRDDDAYVRLAALQLLGELGNRFFQDEVIHAVQDSNQYVKLTAIRMLTNFNSQTTRNQLNRIYSSDKDWRFRGEALLALTQLSPQQTLRQIETDLSETEWPHNYYYIKSLENLTDDKYRGKSTELLQQLADGEKMAQRTLALEALASRTEVPVEFMLDKLDASDPAIATVTATYLSYQKPTQAVEPLIEVYKDFEAPRDIEAMSAIIVALDSIRSQRAVPFLEEQLKNPYPAIQQQARAALINITGDAGIKIPETENAYLTKWDFDVTELQGRKSAQKPQVELSTTKGKIVMELFPDKAPVTAANFLSLVKDGFYDSIYFHRVVPGFVIQGGDPRGDGWGGPGYSIPCEYNDTFYDRGIVGMAHAGKDTGGSQFFITQVPQPHLNGRYTAFGKVIQGMDVVDQIMIYDQIISAKLIQ